MLSVDVEAVGASKEQAREEEGSWPSTNTQTKVPSTPPESSPLRTLSGDKKSAPSSPGRPKSSSGHTVSSLTLAMGTHDGPHERKSFLTDEHAYSSDEENLYVAAKASSITHTHESGGASGTGDPGSVSSSVREFMGIPVGSYDLPSSLPTSTASVDQGRTSFSNPSNLFVDTSQAANSTLHEHTLRISNPSPAEVEMQEKAEKAFAFYGKDLLNAALDYFDSMHTKVANLTAESLASLTSPLSLSSSSSAAAKKASTESQQQQPAAAASATLATRMCSFRLMAAEDDGEIMDDLPEFGLASDVLGMGVNDFAVINRETGETVLLLRILEQSSPRGIHTHTPKSSAYSATGTPTAPMAIGSVSSVGMVSDGSGGGSSTGGAFQFRGPQEIQRSMTDTSDPHAAHTNLTQRRSTRAMSDGHIAGDGGINPGVGKASKVRLCVSCREPTRSSWTVIKKIKVLQAVTDSHESASGVGAGAGAAGGGGGGGGDIPISTFKGAANAAELSALRALAASTAYEIHGTGEQELDFNADAPFTTGMGVTETRGTGPGERTQAQAPNKDNLIVSSSRAGHESGKCSDSSSVSASEVLSPGGGTWQHVTSYGSEGNDADTLDDDSVSQSIMSEATGMSSFASPNPYSGDGGYNDDLEGEGEDEEEDNFNLSMEGSGKELTNATSSSRGHGHGHGHGTSRNRSSSNRSNPDGELFGMDMDME